MHRPLRVALLAVALPVGAQTPTTFRVQETTIAGIHAAMRAGTLTCRALVEAYLRRIDALDKRGPAINAIVTVNPDAVATATDLDRRFARQGLTGPLHCIPVIVKDNYQTAGLQTTAGSLSLKGFVPKDDAFVVRRLREAGAIVLAKSNMDEFAFSPYETVSSILPGYTRNPYDVSRVTAGSSGGTAAAVSDNLGAVGLGTDTGNSIRGPSAFLSLVGIRPTMGLTSRAGVVPLFLGADVTGPMTRTVADATAVLQVIAGPDPADSVTANSAGRVPSSYASFLSRDGLKGARLGVLRQAFNQPGADPEMLTLFAHALGELRAQGAHVIDSVEVDGFDGMMKADTGDCNTFRRDINQYLGGLGDQVTVHSLEAIIKSGKFHPSIEARLTEAQKFDRVPEETPACRADEDVRAQLRVAVLHLMDTQKLDALVYPTWSNPPRLIGDLNTPAGDNNQIFSPATGFPAITVPMGFLRGDRLPAGLQLFGRPWSEGELFRLAYAYEQATHHRRPPGA